MTSPPSPLYGPVAYRLQLLAMIARSRLGSIGYPQSTQSCPSVLELMDRRCRYNVSSLPSFLFARLELRASL